MAYLAENVNLALAAVVCALLLGAGCEKSPPRKFFDAIKAGDLAAVRAALDSEPGWAKAKESDGTPALFLAVLENKAMVEIFLAKGADVNVRNNDKDTPLFWALSTHADTTPFRGDVVKLLIDKGADVNARNDWDNTPLFRAVEGSGTSGVKLLINAGANVNARNDLGSTPLHYAGFDGAVAEMFITHGADVNARDHAGDTPLHYAARLGSEEVAKVLLAHGADVNARNSNGQTPLHKAGVKKGLIDLMVAHGADTSAEDKRGHTPQQEKFFADIESGDIAAVRAALDAEPSWANAKDDRGEPPLCLAALVGRKAMVELLLTKGADGNARGAHGFTALHWAVTNYHGNDRNDVVTVLIGKGADVNATDFGGSMPLHLVTKDCNTGAAELVKLLVNAGADVNAKNHAGDTPVHYAAHAGSEEVLRILLDHGADVNARNSEGQTPLHKVGGKKNLVDLLVSYGADVNARDKFGNLPNQ